MRVANKVVASKMKEKFPQGFKIGNTSRACLSCSHISKDNRTTQAKFECVSCGYTANADYVGACNILRVGHTHRYCCNSTSTGNTCLIKNPPL